MTRQLHTTSSQPSRRVARPAAPRSQRELVLASLLARPAHDRPTHRRWA